MDYLESYIGHLQVHRDWIEQQYSTPPIDNGIGIGRILPMEETSQNQQHGSSRFYALLQSMAELHSRKSHDYASNDSPYGNYHFAGKLSKLFNNPDDAGFIGRLAEKLYRLANLENNGKIASNESIHDTELDICVIIALWMASRQDARSSVQVEDPWLVITVIPNTTICHDCGKRISETKATARRTEQGNLYHHFNVCPKEKD